MNEARQFSEQIIDKLYPQTDLKKQPRSYRIKARKVRRRGINQPLQYLRRTLGHIEQRLDCFPEATLLPLPRWLLHRYGVIQSTEAELIATI